MIDLEDMMYISGNNQYNQSGLNINQDYIEKFQKNNAIKNIEDIYICKDFIVAKTYNDKIFINNFGKKRMINRAEKSFFANKHFINSHTLQQ